MARKPGEIHGWRPHETIPPGRSKTADFEYDTAWVREGVPVASENGHACVGSHQSLAAVSANVPGSRVICRGVIPGVRCALGSPGSRPFCLEQEGRSSMYAWPGHHRYRMDKLMVPGAGIEPAQSTTPRDFKSQIWHFHKFSLSIT